MYKSHPYAPYQLFIFLALAVNVENYRRPALATKR
jgi:hypothetical protein